MHVDELEEMQYQFGRMTEHQNAYALSMIEREPDDQQIADELAKGKFVCVGLQERYCPFTDATMPSRQVFLSSHDTYEEAQAQPERYESEIILPIPRPVYLPVEPSDELPF